MTKKITFRNIRPGQKVLVGDQPAVFLGFSDCDEKHGDGGVKFPGFDELRAAKGYSSFKDMDEAREAAEYGFGHYALFYDLEDGFTYGCYRFEGRFTYGTSATPATLTEA